MPKLKSKKRELFDNIAGWCGAVAIMLAYLMVSFGVLDANSLAYHLLNLTGAIGILIIAAEKHVRQSVIVNVFWAAIALVAILRIAFS